MVQNTTNALAVTADDAELAAIAATKNDLSKLTETQRVQLYGAICRSIGVNPLTAPFAYVDFQGQLKLYALKGCTDQLRDLRGVSVVDVEERVAHGLCIVTVKVTDKTGRIDSEIGAVSIDGLKGVNLANAIMKAHTKAKRRATLSIAGLGFLDESELDALPADKAKIVNVNGQTGRIERIEEPAPAALPNPNRALNRVHALAEKHGFNHADLHLFAVAKGFGSLSAVPDQMLDNISDSFENATEPTIAFFTKLRSDKAEMDRVNAELNATIDAQDSTAAAVEHVDEDGVIQGSLVDVAPAHRGYGDA